MGLFSYEGLGVREAFSSVGRLRIVVVAVFADRPNGWIGVVFIGQTGCWILEWWFVFNVDWVGGAFNPNRFIS